MADPRVFQIAALSGLAVYGHAALGLDLQPANALATTLAALATEGVARKLRGESFDPRSPLVTSLSLILLLRTANPGWAALGACLAVGSKYLVRARGSHVFNPTNFAIVTLVGLGDFAWVSSGQWGHALLLGLALAGAGQFVIHRATRSDVTWVFLLCWSGLLLGRAFWLGDPVAIPLHQLQNGALLIFAFFMISDPRTTPRSRAARAVFACLVACLGFGLVVSAHEPNGLLFALFAAAPCVPLLDRWLPGPVFLWSSTSKGISHASHSVPPLEPVALSR